MAGSVVLMAVEGTTLSHDEASFFKRSTFAGVTLFARNIPDPQVRVVELISQLQNLASDSLPLMIAIDQEGGRVSRLKSPFPNDGPAQFLQEGREDAQALTGIYAYGQSVGSALMQLGINVNFAPVLDVLSEPSNIAIGDRVFGVTPEAVIKRAGAFFDGLQSAGVLGCLKHFPGQGAALVDTHVGSASIDLERMELEEHDILPFRVLAERASMVMLSHCIYSKFDKLPASCSPVIIHELLRDRLGFNGVVLSDDMTMGAVPSDEQAWQEAIVASIAAGVDLVLVCRHVDLCDKAVGAISREAKRSPAFSTRLEQAAGRVKRLRQRLAYQAPSAGD